MEITFVGIDKFNRPVFKEPDKRNYYCLIDDLYGYNQDRLVLKNIHKGLHNDADLYFKGNSPEGEPEYFVGTFGEHILNLSA